MRLTRERESRSCMVRLYSQLKTVEEVKSYILNQHFKGKTYEEDLKTEDFLPWARYFSCFLLFVFRSVLE